MTQPSLATAPHVVSVGELLLRLSPPANELLFQSSHLRWFFGGSEANVAASLARFGVDSEFVTCLPQNAVGDAALAALRAEGIATQHIVRSGNRLGIYFVEAGADVRQMRVVYDRSASAFSEMPAGSVIWEDVLRGADRLHISGITPALSSAAADCAREAVTAARTAGLPVSMDLNFRPAVWAGRDPRSIVRPLASECDVIIGNEIAIAAMLGIASASREDGSSDAMSVVAARVHEELGCSSVAITRRELVSATEHGWSAMLYDHATRSMHASRRYQIAIVDRVGGGDAFAAGLIYALLTGRPPADAIEFGTAAGALKLTIPGDFSRVSQHDVEALLASKPE